MLRDKRDWRGSLQELSCYERVLHFASCRGVKCRFGRPSAIAGETILWRSLWHLSPEQYSYSPGLTSLPQCKKDRRVASQRDPASFVDTRSSANNALNGAGPILARQGRSGSIFKLEVLGINPVLLHFTADFHHLQTSLLRPSSTFLSLQASTHKTS